MKELMTGNEAIARGAWEAGVVFASGYPGTPSTEILENLATYENVYAEWAPNEKVGLESAVGASIAGGRALSTMKHVGMNVAADPLFTVAYTGVNGGLVIVDADDPSCHSSQNEQDNRWYAKSSMVALVEPSDSQECVDYLKEAFNISETYDLPVIFRSTTRVCHSKSIVQLGERIEKEIIPYVKKEKFDPVPAISRKLRLRIEDRTARLKAYANTTPLNRIEEGTNSNIGIITSGISYEHAKEVFGDDVYYLKLGFTYPFPDELVKQFSEMVETLYIIEELDPFIETHVRNLGIACIGKEKIPNHFELNGDIIRKALRGEEREKIDTAGVSVAQRPPVLCAGCPHRGFFYTLARMAKKNNAILMSDIGCYGLSNMAPLSIKDAAICMGGGFSMTHGAQRVFNLTEQPKRVVGVMGDSTFFHSGMTSLLNSLYNRDNGIYVILDNRITGMTGHQNNPGSGFTLQGHPATITKIDAVVKALGASFVREVNPLDLKAMQETLEWAFAQTEPSVIITRWPCALKKFSEADIEEFHIKKEHNKVDPDLCIGCKACIRTGCPALEYRRDSKKVTIDAGQCNACNICVQVCPKQAIHLA